MVPASREDGFSSALQRSVLVQREVRASSLWKLLVKQGTAYIARFHPQ